MPAVHDLRTFQVRLDPKVVDAAIEAWQRGDPIEGMSASSLYNYLADRGLSPGPVTRRRCLWCNGPSYQRRYCCDEHRELAIADARAKETQRMLAAGRFPLCPGCGQPLIHQPHKKYHNTACRKAFYRKKWRERATIMRRDLARGVPTKETMKTLGLCRQAVDKLRRKIQAKNAKNRV